MLNADRLFAVRDDQPAGATIQFILVVGLLTRASGCFIRERSHSGESIMTK
jgi:hypothetical protein